MEMAVKNAQRNEDLLSLPIAKAVCERIGSKNLDKQTKERAMLLVNFLSIASEQVRRGQGTEAEIMKASQSLINEDLGAPVSIRVEENLATKANLAIQFLLSDKQFAVALANEFIEKRVQSSNIYGLRNSRLPFDSVEMVYVMESKLFCDELQTLTIFVEVIGAGAIRDKAANPCIVPFRATK